MKQITKSVFLITLLFNSIFMFAQENDTLEIQRNENGSVKFARFLINTNSNRKMKNDTVFLKSILHTKKEDSFRKIKEDFDELGITHKKFQQYYKGLKVENSEFLIHGKNDNIEVINGDFNNINISNIKPNLNENQALIKVLNYVGSKKYKWEDLAMEEFVKQNTNNPNASYYPKGELVISKDYLNSSNSWKLSWKFTISSMEPNNEQIIYIDAIDGGIINNIPLVFDANVSCTSQTRYSGNQNIIGDSFTGGYRLQENRSNVSIQTLNLNSTYNYTNAVDFINSNTNWDASSWTNFNTDQVALDAHWGAEKVFDFWKTIFSRNSINGSGIRVLSYVHAGSNWGNAQWVGGTNSNFMQYGDGNSMLNPLVALDICAHEFGHGITQFTANLTPGNQESGALNEGFSDIWGACVEYWSAPNKQTWLIGEEIFATPEFDCIRNLQNPKSLTSAEGQHPNVYHGDFWSDIGEPHCNSTILSHWFYLLSQGSNGVQTNELGNCYYIGGISIENAQKIAYRAESLYLNSSADYSAARNATIQAATDLASSIPNAVSEVTNAWYAVGVGNQYQYTISGSSQICTQETYTIDNLPSGATVTWNPYPENIVSKQENGSSVVLTKISSGTITLTATINDCLTLSKTISVSPISAIGLGSYSNLEMLDDWGVYFKILPSGTEWTYRGNLTVSAGSNNTYTWSQVSSYPNDIKWTANGANIDVYTRYANKTIVLKCVANSGCNSSTKNYTFTTSNLIIEPLSLYPNPASNEVSISISEEDNTEVLSFSSNLSNTLDKTYTIQLWNSTSLIKSVKTNNPKHTLSLNGVSTGLYYIHVISGDKIYRKQLIVQ